MGAVRVSASLVTAVRDLLAMVFVVALRLAAPVLIVLLIVELTIGLISRAAPSLSFMVIGYPVRIVVGLFIVGALIYTVPAVTQSMIEAALLLGTRTAAAFR
jgi:flagellar biosynthetic protein FliR